MYELPISVTVGEQEWNIRHKGDFRVVLDCFTALQDTELTMEERVIASMIIFYENLNDLEDFQDESLLEEAYMGMVNFFNCGQPESTKRSSYKLIDWDKDSPLIASAINKVAGKEVRAESYLHWWTFMGYYIAVGECPLSTIVGIRYKRATNKKLEKYEKDFINDNPQYFNTSYASVEDQEIEDWVRKQWNEKR